jgi:protein SCO1/2
MTHPPRLRTTSRWIVLALVLVVGGAIALRNLVGAGGAAPALVAGTVLDGKPAPAFALRDQSGALLSLVRLRGRPVVLTFLDATCASGCPATAQDLDRTAGALGPRAAGVAWLALSVNPANTRAQAADFLARNRIAAPLRILLGTDAQLAPLWKAYSIAVAPAPGGATRHTAVTYLLDKQGRERELLDQAYDPNKAAQDLRALLAA